MTEQVAYVAFSELYEVPSKNGISVPTGDRGNGVAMVNMKELFAFDRLDTSAANEKVPLPAGKEQQWLLKKGDLLFGRRSLVLEGAGKCVLVENADSDATFESSIIRVRLDDSRCNPAFYFYYFNTPIGRSVMESIVEQVAVAGIRSSDLATLQVPVPSKADQDALVASLGKLDAVIDKNRAIQRGIEQLSKLLYRSLTVDCDDYVSLTQVAEINPERVGKPSDETIRFLSITDVKDGAINWPAPVNWTDAPAASRLLAQSGDVVWSRVRPNRRSHALLVELDEKTVVTTGMVVIRPTTVGSSFLWATCDDSSFSSHLTALADGTAYPTVDVEVFEEIQVPLPSEEKRKDFEDLMWPMWKLHGEIDKECESLRASITSLAIELFSGRLVAGVIA